MSTKLITDNFKTHSARQFYESFSESANTIYYVFAARSLSYDDDATIPAVNTALNETHYNIYGEMLFGKRVSSSDVVHMTKRVNWQSGNTFAPYSNLIENISNTDFFVVSQEGDDYHVFKCLDNNGGAATSDQPLFSETSAEDEFYQTNDGYVWKYMWKISASNWSKFATTNYIPVIIDANVTSNAVSGSIDAIKINSSGIGYNAYCNGTILEAAVAGNTLLFSLQSSSFTLSANTDFYKGSSIYIRSGTGAGQVRNISEYIVTGSLRRVLINSAFTTLPDTTSVFEIGPQLAISGDGTGASAIATINASSNSINTVEIVTRGSGYTYADIKISSNGVSITDANLSPIISPPGGHGSNVINETIANKVGLSISFANTESNTIPTTNDFRKIGLIKNPLFANTELTLSTSVASSFTDGETIQTYTSQAANTLLETFTYTLSLYQTLALNSNTGFSIGDDVSFEAKSGTVLNANASHIDIRLSTSSEAFAATDYIGDGTITKTISSISSAQPPIVITGNAHTIANGTAIVLQSLDGTALVEGTTYYAKYINTTAFSIYTDSGITTPFDNSANSAATSGYVTTGSAVANVTSAAYTFTGNNDPISGHDDRGNRFGMIPSSGTDVPITMVVTLNGVERSATHDTTSLTLTDITLVSNSDVIEAKLYTTQETILTMDDISATTGIVSNRAGTILRLSNVSGDFSVGQEIKGLSSGTIATIDAIDRNFITFNQLTKMAVQIISTGTSGGGIANTGFNIDQMVTQAQGPDVASGYVFSVSNTVTRHVSSITATNPALVTTTIAHGFANSQSITFQNLNGTALGSSNSYFVQTTNTTSFYVYTDSGLITGFDNTSNTSANNGTVISSGIGGVAANAYRTFYLNNVKGIFGVSDDATSTVNTFISNTTFGGTGAIAKITSRTDPDLVDNSGEILYIENMLPIERANDQSEKIKIIIEF